MFILIALSQVKSFLPVAGACPLNVLLGRSYILVDGCFNSDGNMCHGFACWSTLEAMFEAAGLGHTMCMHVVCRFQVDPYPSLTFHHPTGWVMLMPPHDSSHTAFAMEVVLMFFFLLYFSVI